MDELPALPSNAPPSGNAPSPQNGVQSSADGFSSLARTSFFSQLSGALPGPVQETFVSALDHSRSGYGPSSPLPFWSADGTD